MITEQQNRDYFAGIGIDYDKLNEEEKEFLKGTTMYKWYVLGVAWDNLFASIKESIQNIKFK